jgi:tungstate transport system substrate-binding protein
VIVVNPERHPHVKVKLAEAFVDFLLSDEGQKLISGFTVNGQQLFFTY